MSNKHKYFYFYRVICRQISSTGPNDALPEKHITHATVIKKVNHFNIMSILLCINKIDNIMFMYNGRFIRVYAYPIRIGSPFFFQPFYGQRKLV